MPDIEAKGVAEAGFSGDYSRKHPPCILQRDQFTRLIEQAEKASGMFSFALLSALFILMQL